MKRYVDLDEILKFPIREDHYDEKNGNLDFVLGIESLMEYVQSLPVVTDIELTKEELEIRLCKGKLLECFPGSFFNDKNEFIADKKSNAYFIFDSCYSELDVKCKVIEWLTRYVAHGHPYEQEWRNKRYKETLLNGINQFLGTNFNLIDIYDIYEKYGNGVNHSGVRKFIQHDYDLSLLQEKER